MIAKEYSGRFGLKAFPGQTFRVNADKSFLGGPNLDVMKLAVQVFNSQQGEWVDFSTSTAEELNPELTRIDLRDEAS